VHAGQRLGDGHQPSPPARALGQRLADIGGVALDEGVHHRAQRALVQSLGGGVHGHQRAGVDGLVVARLDELPVLHLQCDLVLEAGALAVQNQLLPALEQTREPAAAEDRRGAVAAGVAQQQHQRHAGAARRGRTDTGDDSGARDHLADLDRAQRGEACAVLVADRQEEERVLDGLQALLGEQLRALGTRPP
jgi:hypothetical protein